MACWRPGACLTCTACANGVGWPFTGWISGKAPLARRAGDCAGCEWPDIVERELCADSTPFCAGLAFRMSCCRCMGRVRWCCGAGRADLSGVSLRWWRAFVGLLLLAASLCQASRPSSFMPSRVARKGNDANSTPNVEDMGRVKSALSVSGRSLTSLPDRPDLGQFPTHSSSSCRPVSNSITLLSLPGDQQHKPSTSILRPSNCLFSLHPPTRTAQ